MPHEVAAALIVQAGTVLLGKRSGTRQFYPNVWDLFGGHVEPGEQADETLVRELEEELGIRPTSWTYLEKLAEPALELTMHLYLVTAWTGQPVNRQPEEHSEIAWFSLEQASGLPLAHPGYPMLFEQYL